MDLETESNEHKQIKKKNKINISEIVSCLVDHKHTQCKVTDKQINFPQLLLLPLQPFDFI